MTAPSPFSAQTPGFQTSWDSTSLGWFKECAYKYKLTMLDHWTPRSKGVHLMFGGLYASGLEHYAHYLASGQSHDEATVGMVRWVLENAGTRDCEECSGSGYCTYDDLHDPEDGALLVPAHTRCRSCDGTEKGTVWRPWSPGDHKDANIKNLYTLVRSLVWNVEERLTSPYSTVILANGKPAVELSFSFHAFDVASEPIFLSGHMDEVVQSGDDIWVRDDKAQPAHCKVLTSAGWTTIGELKVGDRIAGCDGKFHNVTALYPKGNVATYKVEFDDHTHTYCAYDHLWRVADACGKLWRTRTLENIIKYPSKTNLQIPVCSPVEHEETTLLVDPYLLGALLGDGYLGGNSVAITTSKLQLIENLHAAVARMGDIFRKNPSDNLVWTITNKRNCATLKGLQALKLWGCLSAAKFIPRAYLFASIEQRRALLRGLLDTDGSWDGTKRRYQTMSRELAHGVAELVRSLGGSAAVTFQTRNMWRVTLRVLEDGMAARRRSIANIEQVEDCENICVAVDAPDHLYLTDNHIVTHNTTKGALGANYFQQFSPNNQMSLYSVAGRVILNAPVRGVLVKAAQIGVTFTRFQTSQVPRPQAVLTEWLEDTRGWIEQAHHAAVTGHYPKNDKSCGNYGGCPFQKVCSVSPSHRDAWLEQDFMKSEWNPLKSRGDV